MIVELILTGLKYGFVGAVTAAAFLGVAALLAPVVIGILNAVAAMLDWVIKDDDEHDNKKEADV